MILSFSISFFLFSVRACVCVCVYVRNFRGINWQVSEELDKPPPSTPTHVLTRLLSMISLKFLYSSPLGALLTGSRIGKCPESEQVVPAERDPAVAGDTRWSRYAAAIPRAQSFKGVLLQGYLLHPHVLRGLADFKIRQDDVFIITYPKSGTTWMEEIVSLIMNGGDPDRVKNKLLVYRVQHLEVGPPVGHLWHLRKTRSPRLLATHLPLKLIPIQLQQAKCKVGRFCSCATDLVTTTR